jgi:hypothetical protein
MTATDDEPVTLQYAPLQCVPALLAVDRLRCVVRGPELLAAVFLMPSAG